MDSLVTSGTRGSIIGRDRKIVKTRKRKPDIIQFERYSQQGGEAKRERETICHRCCKCEITDHNRRRCDQDRQTVLEVDSIFRKDIVTRW